MDSMDKADEPTGIPDKNGDDDNGGGQKKEGEGQEEQAAAPKTYDRLDKDKLYEALFVMADCWCPDIDEQQYKEFFGQLDWRLKYSGMADNTAYDVL